MSLSFRKKKQGTKPIYIILSILAFLAAATLLTVWLIIGYHRSAPSPEENTESTTQPTYEEPTPDVANCLVILKMEDHTKFVLVQTNPEDNRISAVPLPAIIADENQTTLSHLFKSHGSGRVVDTVSKALELPIKHHITLDADGIQEFLSDLDQGIMLDIPKSIAYTDENGLTSTVRAGERQLTATQALAVLEYSDWDNGDEEEKIAAEMIASLFNHYLVADRSIRGYFGALANVAQTDLRIDNYTTYSSALTTLAENNDGTICSVVTLEGTIQGGYFVPDVDAIRRNAGLHTNSEEGDR